MIGPDEKIVAGPKRAAALATVAVCGLLDASAESSTLGVGATGTPGGTPPKIVRFGTKYPEALPMIVVVRRVVVVVVLPIVVVVVLVPTVVVVLLPVVGEVAGAQAVPSEHTVN